MVNWNSPRHKNTCSDCAWFEWGHGASGSCKARSPIAIQEEGDEWSAHAVWPTVSPGYYCGDFKPEDPQGQDGQ